jgi:hypothetical protein
LAWPSTSLELILARSIEIALIKHYNPLQIMFEGVAFVTVLRALVNMILLKPLIAAAFELHNFEFHHPHLPFCHYFQLSY